MTHGNFGPNHPEFRVVRSDGGRDDKVTRFRPRRTLEDELFSPPMEAYGAGVIGRSRSLPPPAPRQTRWFSLKGFLIFWGIVTTVTVAVRLAVLPMATLIAEDHRHARDLEVKMIGMRLTERLAEDRERTQREVAQFTARAAQLSARAAEMAQETTTVAPVRVLAAAPVTAARASTMASSRARAFAYRLGEAKIGNPPPDLAGLF